MNLKLSKREAEQKIHEFFKKDSFNREELMKIRRLAMKLKIKLGEYRRKYCKKCLFPLKGKIRLNKGYKTIQCKYCGFINRMRVCKN